MLVLVACGAPAHPAPIASHQVPIAAPTPPPPEVEWTALVGPIRTVDVTSPDATLVPRARELVTGEVGKPIDRQRLRGELADVLALHGVADVSARGVQLADGVRLVVELTPQATVHALAAHEAGGAAVSLPGQLATAVGLPIDPALLDSIAGMLRDRYLVAGHVDAAVEWHATPAGAGLVDVAIEITPGNAVTIDRVEFTGTTHAKREDLIRALDGELAPGTPWVSDHVERARLILTSYYYDHGFIDVLVSTPTPTGERVAVVFPIKEGNQYRIGKLEVTGVDPKTAKSYQALAGVKSGDVFDRSKLAAGLDKIREAAHANVVPQSEVHPDRKRIDFRLEVSKPEK